MEGEFGPRFLPQDIARIPICQLVALWLDPDRPPAVADPFALKPGEKVVAMTGGDKRNLTAEEQAAIAKGKAAGGRDPRNPAGLSPEALAKLNRVHGLAVAGLLCRKCGREKAAKFVACGHCGVK